MNIPILILMKKMEITFIYLLRMGMEKKFKTEDGEYQICSIPVPLAFTYHSNRSFQPFGVELFLVLTVKMKVIKKVKYS